MMKRLCFNLFSILCVVFFVAGIAQADSYTFSGSDEGGVGSATMDFSTDINKVIVTLDNTSPIDLMGGTDGGNSPGITAFGFNLDPDTLELMTWELWAYDTDGETALIGDQNNTLPWQIQTFFEGITLEYIPTAGSDINYSLFNPEALSDPNNTLPGGINVPYFTTAVLTMNFNAAPSLNDSDPFSPFVKMVNVGVDGEGSLRLGTPVPEPATMLWLGTALFGLFMVSRKKFMK